MDYPASKPFKFNLSAPGKIILFGEYSVVFNKPALAGALCLRTRLRFEENSTGIVHVKFSALNLEKEFDLTDVKNYFTGAHQNENWGEYLARLNNGIRNLCLKTLSESQNNCLLAFFHCFQNCMNFSRGFKIEIDSELPVGCGVGSSASFSVVLSAAFLLYQHHLKGSKSVSELVKR